MLLTMHRQILPACRFRIYSPSICLSVGVASTGLSWRWTMLARVFDSLLTVEPDKKDEVGNSSNER